MAFQTIFLLSAAVFCIGSVTAECPPVCYMYCPYGNILDDNGCPLCRCNPPPEQKECPPLCRMYCEYGNVLDENECPICKCNPPPEKRQVINDERLPYAINCDSQICAADARPWCLFGQPEPVQGHCDLQNAVCGGAEIDFSNSCFIGAYSINCAQPRTCARDLRRWCLVGQSEPVLGHCDLQDAICDNNAVFDPSQSCLQR